MAKFTPPPEGLRGSPVNLERVAFLVKHINTYSKDVRLYFSGKTDDYTTWSADMSMHNQKFNAIYISLLHTPDASTKVRELI